jgi:carbonic anhydrase/acetyltransferase-like protein (isoleucine patch superfamily)
MTRGQSSASPGPAGPGDAIESLLARIAGRVEVNLREFSFSAAPHLAGLPGPDRLRRGHAFFGLTPHHPLDLHLANSALAGSYLIGPCRVESSVVYQSDLRGDELKRAGAHLSWHGGRSMLYRDERISVRDSCLIRTLVHNFSHDPEDPEEFYVHNTLALPYANIHGSPVEGCFLGPLATLDLTTAHDCLIGAYSYLQTGELHQQKIDPGRVWIRPPEAGFEFDYRYPAGSLEPYVRYTAGREPKGLICEMHQTIHPDLARVMSRAQQKGPAPSPPDGFQSCYSVLKGEVDLGQNVLVAQRAYVEDSRLGPGSNAQENCCLIRARLDGRNVTAHGGMIADCRLGERVFVGFNSLLRGREGSPLTVGRDSIVMPHTIVDVAEGTAIPPGSLVWGLIREPADLAECTMPLDELKGFEGELTRGGLKLSGSGGALAEALLGRITHILEANGAFYNGSQGAGHAQEHQSEAYNILQPYPSGPLAGLYPSFRITP